MGMFDDVNFKMACPTCGHVLDSFQTKDADCDLSTVEPDNITNFYCACRNCGSWIEFFRNTPRLPRRDTPLTLEQVQAMGFVLKVTEPAHKG